MDVPSGASSSKNDSLSDTKTYTNISKFGKIYLLLTIMTTVNSWYNEFDVLDFKFVIAL